MAGPGPSLVAGPVCGLGPLEGRTLAEAIGARVAMAPEGRFWNLRQDGAPRSRTYRELWDRSGRMAAALAALSLPPASPIALVIGDGEGLIPAFWACLRAGHVALPLTSIALEHRHEGRSKDLAQALASARPALVVADEVLAAAVPQALPCARVTTGDLDGRGTLDRDAAPAELACLLPTSGSTGTMKLVAISGRAMLHRCFTTLHAGVQDGGAYVNTFPIDSTTGVRCMSLNYREYAHLPMDVVARAPTALLDAVETLRAGSFSVTNTVADLVMSAAPADAAWDLSSLRQVAVGSETVLPSTMRRFDEFLRRFGAPGGIIRAGYGTTETGLLVTGADPLSPDPTGRGSAPLGAAAPNVEIRVVDRSGGVVPEGTLGDVEVRTPLKMFSSYWNDPEAMEHGFTPDGWWRTGDTGLLWDGQLALDGRAKEVVVFNGRKHALGAIDEAVRRALDPGETAYACTLPGRDGTPEALGVALSVSPERRAAAEAGAREAVGRTFGLSIRVVRPMPPSAIPLTPTGKVKRRDLAALLAGPVPAIDAPPAALAPAATGDIGDWLRRSIARATSRADAEIDARAPIGALGLDSLAILSLKGEFAARFGRDAPPSLAWQDSSIAEVAAALSGEPASVAAGPSTPTLDAGPATPRRDGLLPLSSGQEHHWRYARAPDARPHYQRLVRFAIRGPMRLDLLRDTLDEVVRRHEHLRTTFAEVDGVAGQRIHAPSPAAVVFTDLSAHRRPRKALDEVRRAAAARVLDLETGPLLVAYVTRIGAQDHRFDLLLHHVLYDARSFAILFGEIDRIYGSLVDGRRSPPVQVPLQMADVARDEQRSLDRSGAGFADEVRWWRDYWLRCAPSRTRFRFERAKPAGSVRAADCVLRREVPRGLHQRLKAVSLERGTSLFVAYCAAAAVALVRNSAGDDIVLGTYLSNRSAAAQAATLGYMVNLVQFHLAVGGASTWPDVMARTHDAVVAVTAHRGVPHHLLTGALREGGTAVPPLQAVFQYLLVDQEWTIPGLTIEREREVESQLIHRYVSFNVMEWGGDVSVTLKLNGHRHHTASVAPLMRMFIENLESLAGAVPLLTAKVRPPSLLSRVIQASRSSPFSGREKADRSVAEPGAEADDLRREIGLLRRVAGERADLVERLHAEAERQRGEVAMLRSVADERAGLIERLHAETECQRGEAVLLRSVAEERAGLIAALHGEVERRREEIAALRVPADCGAPGGGGFRSERAAPET